MSEIHLCDQCAKKYVDNAEHNGLCDSCYKQAMDEEYEENLKGCFHELIKQKGKKFAQHLIDCHE